MKHFTLSLSKNDRLCSSRVFSFEFAYRLKAAAAAVRVIPTAFGLLRKRKLREQKPRRVSTTRTTRIHVNVS